ncbi:MAG: NeuD/PglB/VioB family sugar acetyltransferase [Erysipelotrichaceae bacterium]|nr:NeuD/PglB/VioB family sugar acetyltransferase [Erysipelotrichaceae bacterium]
MENKLKDLIIMGAGDLGKDVAWLVERINAKEPEWNLLGFTEISELREFMGYPVLGEDDVIEDYKDVYVVCALASLTVKSRIMEGLPDNVKVATLIDPSAVIHKSAVIEEGSMVFANALVGVNAHVGRNCLVLHNSAVNHDVELGDYSIVYPNATISGKCTIGRFVEIGTGASLIQGISVCDNAKIGVGAAVFTTIKNPGMTVGNPAVTMGSKKKESK